MIKLPVLLLQTCAIILINIDFLVPILASKKPSHMDGYLVENHRTRRKENYVLQRALTDNIENNDNGDMTYATEPLDPNTNPEELPALIVDYANMIRNDIILLDNSVETRTRKRGNVKVQRRSKDADLDRRCTCEQENRELILLGENYIPKTIEATKCNRTLCPSLYGCRKRFHNITVLKTRNYAYEESQEELPLYLRKNFIAVKVPVLVGCFCTREHTDNINVDY